MLGLIRSVRDTLAAFVAYDSMVAKLAKITPHGQDELQAHVGTLVIHVLRPAIDVAHRTNTSLDAVVWVMVGAARMELEDIERRCR